MKCLTLVVIFLSLCQSAMALSDKECNDINKLWLNLDNQRNCDKILEIVAGIYPPFLLYNEREFEGRLGQDWASCKASNQIKLLTRELDTRNFGYRASTCANDYTKKELTEMYHGTPTDRDRLVMMSPYIIENSLNEENSQFLQSLLASKPTIKDELLVNDLDSIESVLKLLQKASETNNTHSAIIAMEEEELQPQIIQNHIDNLDILEKMLQRTTLQLDARDYKEFIDAYQKFFATTNQNLPHYKQELQKKVTSF